MKKVYLLLFFFSLGVQVMSAQSEFRFILNKEGKIIAIPKMEHFEFNIPEFSYKSYTPASTRMIDDMLKAYEPASNSKLDERPMDMQILSGAYEPFYNEYAPMIRRVSPTAFDFREVEFFPLNENLTFAILGQQQTWPGLGGTTTVDARLVWANGPWQVDGGGFASRYYTPYNLSPKLVTGVNLHASLQATDWLKIHSWGQFAGYSGKEWSNPHMLMNPHFHHNSIGTALEFKLNENFGVGAGVQYDFNPMKNKWERQVILFPVFR